MPPVVTASANPTLRVARDYGREVSKRMPNDRFLVPQYEGVWHTLTRP